MVPVERTSKELPVNLDTQKEAPKTHLPNGISHFGACFVDANVVDFVRLHSRRLATGYGLAPEGLSGVRDPNTFK